HNVGQRSPHRGSARRRAASVLEERLRFETLLSGVSGGLIPVPASAIDAALARALQQVAMFLGVDRGSLDVYAGGDPGIRISWALPGLEEPPRVMDADQFPWAAMRLRRGDIVRFSRIDELPENAALDRENYKRGVRRSKVSIPLSAGGPMLGVLSFGSVRSERAWPAELVERLCFFGGRFAS